MNKTIRLLVHNRLRSFSAPLIMGILNVTPDSFSDGGKFLNPEIAFQKALRLIANGAQIIDIGGESTGPGSVSISEKVELHRVLPVIKKLVDYRARNPRPHFLISIDTYKPYIAQAAIQAGIDIVNDVTALRFGGPEMAELIAKNRIPLILMYSKDPTARTTKKKVRYQNVIKTISNFLKRRIQFAHNHDIKQSQIIIDPGMGAFISGIGQYSFDILKSLSQLQQLGYPIIIGTSRKGFLGEALGDAPPNQRLIGTILTSLHAIQNGASIIRVHDVAEIKQALTIWKKIAHS